MHLGVDNEKSIYELRKCKKALQAISKIANKSYHRVR